MRTGYFAVVATTIALAGCGSDPAAPVVINGSGSAGPGTSMSGLALSAPVADPAVAGGEPGTVVFVSVSPGSVAHASSAQVRTGDAPGHTVGAVDGGFDPVAVRGVAGDQVVVTITDSTGKATTTTGTAKEHARPRVVRISPAPQRTDVPLNAVIKVVFSAPMMLESLVDGVHLLQGGTAVPATVVASDLRGLIFEVQAAAELEPGVSYQLVIGATVADVNGTPLGEAESTFFTTATPPTQPLPLQVVTVSVTTTGTEIDGDGYVLSLSGPIEADGQLVELSIPSNGTSAARSLSAGTYGIALTGVAGNCYPTGRALRQVVITQDLTLPVAVRCEPSRQLAYVAGEGDYSDILVASTSGAPVVRLTSNTVADSNPAWSPDGRHLAFTSHRSGSGDIYVMDADGSNVRRLTTSPAPDFQPTWSSDGARIAYASARAGNVDVYVIQADGSGEQRLTADPGDDRDPAWSPTGGRIAFVSTRDGGGMFTMSPDGSDVRLLAANGLSPAWSHAGDQIAFSFYNSNVNNPWPGPTLTVVIVNSDGSWGMRLDDTEYYFAATNLSWGVDGRIAFASNDTHTITGVQPDGTGLNPIVLTDATNPAWRP